MQDDDVIIEILLEGVDVDWTRQADELLHYLSVIVREETGSSSFHLSSGVTRPGLPHPLVALAVDPEALPSELLIVKADPHPRFYVAVADRSQLAGQAEIWAAALRLACDTLNDEHPVHDWHAIIGHVGPANRGAQVITEPAHVAGMYVHAAKEPYLEDVPLTGGPSLAGSSVITSYPVFVEGQSRGFSWPSASRKGAEDLNLLCALLSLAFGVEWRIRESLQPRKYDGRVLASPPTNGVLIPFAANTARQDVIVPDWIGHVYAAIKSDEIMLNAVNAHHSGLSLERVSVSYALLAYVGAIEGLGVKLLPMERCECCAKCTVVKGAEARFNASINLVCSEAERRHLARIYATRSKTAHEGRLYGGERNTGSLSVGPSLWELPSESVFSLQTIGLVRDVSARVIEFHLNRMMGWSSGRKGI